MSCASSALPLAHLDEHGVHAASTLDVLVAVEDVAVGRLDAHDVAQLDLLLERDLQLLELRCPLGDGVGSLGGDEVDQRRGLGLEQVAPGDEVGLALELDDRADVAVDLEGDEALVVLAVVALGAGRETLLTEVLLGGLDVAIGGFERLLAVHHPSARALSQGLDILGGERHRGVQLSVSVSVSAGVVGRRCRCRSSRLGGGR